MMRTHDLGRGIAPLSELAFGTASIGGRVTPRAGVAALEAAIEAGITGLDLARSYGYGTAEAIVGEALRHRRDQVVLVSKAGIEPAPPPSPLLLALGRLVPTNLRLRRQLAGRVAPTAAPLPLEPLALRRSLEASLTALRTDRIDVFLAHRCPASPVEYDVVAAAFEDARAAGHILTWGICGAPADVFAVSAHAPPPVAQVPGNVLTRHHRALPTIATRLVMFYQPFGGGAGHARLVRLAPRDLSPAERARWATEVALRGLLTTSPLPAVAVCAMNQRAHVAANAQALSHPRLGDTTLARICERLSREAP